MEYNDFYNGFKNFSHIGRFSETFSRKPFFIFIFFDFRYIVTPLKTRKSENARYMV